MTGDDADAGTFPLAVRRRTLLAATAGVATLAGCGGRGSPDESTPTTAGSETATDTRTATETAAPTTEATTTEQETADQPLVVEFDGGGAAAFADALDAVADEPGATLRVVDGPHRLDASAAPALDGIRTHFALTDAEDVTIDGNGQSLVFTEPSRGALHVEDGENVTVRNLTVDYDPLPFTQGVVDEWNPEERELVLALDSGYPSLSAPVFAAADRVQGTVHRGDGGPLRRVNGHGGAFKRFSAIDRLGSRRFRLTLASGIGTSGLAEGRRLALAARFASARGVRFRRCIDPRVENVTIRTAAGFAMYCNYCAGPVVRNVTIAPPPGSDRLISGCSDGVHLDNCRETPVVEGCRIDRIEDDGIVVDTQLLEVTAVVDGRTVRVAPSVGSLVGAGDRLEAASPAFERKGELPRVERIDMQGGGWTDGPELPDTIAFADTVGDTLSPGDLLTSRSFENRGFRIRNNEVRHSNARLVRIGGGAEGVVELNTLVGNNNDGILVEANGGGTPKRWVDDLVIRRNTLRDIGLTSVTAGRPEGIVVQVDGEPVYDRDEPSPAGQPHRNVAIADNTLTNVATTGIHVADTRTAAVVGNEIVDPGRIRMTAFDRYGFGLDHTADVAIDTNNVVGTGADVDGFGWRAASRGLTLTENSLVVDGEDEPARLVDLDGG